MTIRAVQMRKHRLQKKFNIDLAIDLNGSMRKRAKLIPLLSKIYLILVISPFY